MSGALVSCLAGEVSAEVALARLVLAGEAPEAVARRIAALPDGAVRERLLVLAGPAGARLRGLARLREAVPDHAESVGIAAIAAGFDRAVAAAPEASVAAYSLNDAGILARATAEVVAWLWREALVWEGAAVLDLGCGTGRVAAALAARVGAVLGLDVSAGMVAEARRRHGGMEGLRFAVTDGEGLGGLPEVGFDLVLAVDSFPYLMLAGRGVAERHVADAARVLRAGGALAVLNLSYRGDGVADVADARGWAARFGFRLTHAGVRPFALWDGAAFVFRR